MVNNREALPIELGGRETLTELVYLMRRARFLWLRITLVALALAGLYAVRKIRAVPEFESRVVLRISEGEGDRGTRPRPARQIQSHVYDVIFNKQRLRELADKFGLERSAFARDNEAGLENLRDAIEVEVWQNYFLDEYAQEKTARIAISYTGGDPQKVLQVTRALATMYIEEEQQARLSISEDALGANEQLIDEGREDLERAEGRVAEARLKLAQSRDVSTASLELGRAEVEMAALRQQFNGLEQRRTELEVQLGYERHQLGLHIEIVDNGKEAPEGLARPIRVLLGSVIVFVMGLFGAGILIAAFDDRVRDRRDLRLIGMPLLGELPPPPDPGSQSLARRLARALRGKG